MAYSFYFSVFCLILQLCLAWSHFVDPSDYFAGVQHRPKLEIVYPDNGAVLDHGDLTIIIRVAGYELPSQFHDSSICVGLSTGFSFAEQCFDQTDLTFHVNGLSAGLQYAVRIVLYERKNAIAVSVRNFRVAGIRGVTPGAGSEDVVTIRTAVQVAMQLQTSGMEAQAESIYRSILAENPEYADALHLLGLLMYHKGDALSALPYVEKAAEVSNVSIAAFHNTLGACYRQLGRLEDAQTQFKIALALAPNTTHALYNLGLLYQNENNWLDAIEVYRNLSITAPTDPEATPQLLVEIKLRECDLLQGLRRFKEAKSCWEAGIVLDPTNQLMHNELGNVHFQVRIYASQTPHTHVCRDHDEKQSNWAFLVSL